MELGRRAAAFHLLAQRESGQICMPFPSIRSHDILTNTVQCYFMGEDGRPSGPMIAAFSCAFSAGGAADTPSQAASLKVYPHGLRVLDHIVLSALVVERKRLTPSLMGFHSLFN